MKSFSSMRTEARAPTKDGHPVRYRWEVSAETADALHLQGGLSDELLRHQLESAIAE